MMTSVLVSVGLAGAAVPAAAVTETGETPGRVITGFGSVGSWSLVGSGWSLADDRLAQTDTNGVRPAFFADTAFGDVSVRVRFRVEPVGGGVQTAGIILRSTDGLSGYHVHYDTRNDQIILMRGNPLGPYVGEVTRRRGIPLDTERWHSARASVIGNRIEVYLDNRLVLHVEDETFPSGRIGLYTSQGHVEFRDLEVAGEPVTMDPPWRVKPAGGLAHRQALATILETKVLCKQPGRYIGWPTIAIAPNRDVLVVFSGDREGHVSPDGKTQMVRSTDGGRTWADPVTINDLRIDDRDAGLVRTSEGTMVASWFTGPPYHTDLQGHYVMRSTDNGHTWSLPIRTQVTAPHGPIQLADGRLLFIGLRPHCSHTKPANYNGTPAGSPHTVCIEQSSDDGRTWTIVGDLPLPGDARMLSFDEPHMVQAADGKLIAQFRDCNQPHRLWQSESTDGGAVWTTPRQTRIHGYPPHLLRLHNGWLLSTYGKRWAPFGEYACVSRDNGETWDVENEIMLSSALDGDLGYPASAQLDDGTIWTVYYEADVPGEKPCLKATHWRLEARRDPR